MWQEKEEYIVCYINQLPNQGKKHCQNKKTKKALLGTSST